LNNSGDQLVKRTRVVRDYPINTLEDILIVPFSIHSNNAGLPIDRKLLAKSLGTTHKSSGYITKINSSFSYGLTVGGYKDELISLTELGRSIVAPKNNEEYETALRESAFTPMVFEKIYKVLEGKILPGDPHMVNLLEREFKLPSQISKECLGILKSNGIFTGLIKETLDGLFVVDGAVSPVVASTSTGVNLVSSRDLINTSMSSDSEQILVVSDIPESDSLKSIYSLLETIGVRYTQLSILKFESIDGKSQNIEEEIYLKINQCKSAIIYLKNPEEANNQDLLDVNLMFNLGALFYRYDMKVVIVLESPGEFSNIIKEFDPIVLNESVNNDINKLLLNKMVNKGIIKITV